MGYYNCGRHRAPTTTGRRTAAVVTTGALAVAPVLALAGTANADVLDDISLCESGNNPQAQNPSSTASGRWQFLTSTWLSSGGGKYGATAADATPGQQREIAERLYAAQGTSPWNASRSCWSGKSGGEPAARSSGASSSAASSSARSSGGSDTASASKPRRSSSSASGSAASGKRAADGSGSYVCSAATLYFADCDETDLGETMQYPVYDRGSEASVPIKRVSVEKVDRMYVVQSGDWMSTIAAAHDVNWRELWAANKGTVTDPHWLRAGQVLRIPS